MKDTEKLILFDLDGTLIDKNYTVTDENIGWYIRQAQAAGWSVGLNSDTPLEQLQWWRDQLCMTGPIIAEMGAVVECNGEVIYDTALNLAVERSKKQCYDYLLKRNKTAVITGNATKNVKSESYARSFDSDIETFVYLNTTSMCSLRYFVRKRSVGGKLEVNDAATQRIYGELAHFDPSLVSKTIDNNSESGLIIVSDGEITKRSGLKLLLSRCSIGRVVMVGNSINDYMGQDIVEHYCVSNTEDSFKDASQLLDEPFTKGCVEAIRRLT